MAVWKLAAVAGALFGIACSAQGLSFTVDKEHWISKNWQDDPLDDPLGGQVASLLKRSKARQFYGLMGKRSDTPQPVRVNRRRNKGGSFVGLMGRRSLSPDETSAAFESAEDSEKPDLQDLDKLVYY
ncbi:protachykinin-1 [Denticeps clupeoides]|uniref:protachykinin-1 n=1 Tax=Denticeps clupeoides TaxID=299321 RepID=UPI0010A34A49|nr:protachykinin-1-like [Denticeps clupeoides]